MSSGDFDPTMLGRYDKPPALLHFEFGEGTVYRYVCVQAFKVHELDGIHRRTDEENARGAKHADIRLGLLQGIKDGSVTPC